MDAATVVLTIWVCLASQPHCSIAQDPTGPPVVKVGPPPVEACEAHVKSLLEAYPPPKGYIARHTCVLKGGTDI